MNELFGKITLCKKEFEICKSKNMFYTVNIACI